MSLNKCLSGRKQSYCWKIKQEKYPYNYRYPCEKQNEVRRDGY